MYREIDMLRYRTRWAAWERFVLLLLAWVSLALARESLDLIESSGDDSPMEESYKIKEEERRELESISSSRQTKEKAKCPPHFDGWMTTRTCQQYFWCSRGVVSSMSYPCANYMLFDLKQSTCRNKNEVSCGSIASSYFDAKVDKQDEEETFQAADPEETFQTGAGEKGASFQSAPVSPDNPDNPDSPGNTDSYETQAVRETEVPTVSPTGSEPPTLSPSEALPPRIYYADFSTKMCLSENRPPWITEKHMFRDKAECCRLSFDWVPLRHCTEGYTHHPSVSPSLSIPPTEAPTQAPNPSPSAMPTDLASAMPSALPSAVPTALPTALASAQPSVPPTQSQAPSASPSLSPSLSFKPTKDATLAEAFAATTTSTSTTTSTTSATTSATTSDPFVGTDPTYGGNTGTFHSSVWVGGSSPSSPLPMDTSPVDDYGYGYDALTTVASGPIVRDFTRYPTSRPTRRPTRRPTPHPTTRPTKQPTEEHSYIVELIQHVNDGIDTEPYPPPIETPRPTFYPTLSPTFPPTALPTSSPTDPPTPSPTSQPTPHPTDKPVYSITEIVLPVMQDATVSEQRPNLNFGSHSSLAVNGPVANQEHFASLLKFDMSLVDFDRIIDSATLKIYAVEGCQRGGTFRTTSSSNWSSGTVTWNVAPVADGQILGTLGQVLSGLWYSLDALSSLDWFYHHVQPNQEHYMTVRIDSTGAGRCLFSSTENLEKGAARIIVKYGTPSPTDAPIGPPIVPKTSPLPPPPTPPSPPPPPPPPKAPRPLPSHPKTPPKQNLPTQPAHPSSPQTPSQPQPAISSLSTIDPSTFTGYLRGDFTLLSATDDATIIANAPSSNFGHEPSLMVAFDVKTRGIYDALIRFDLSQLQNTLPHSALLSLFAEMDCESAGTLMTTQGNGEWNHDYVTWTSSPMYIDREEENSKPSSSSSQMSNDSFGGTMIGTFGKVRADRWHGFDVKIAIHEALMNNKSAITFKMTSGFFHSCSFTSIEGKRAPKLLVSF